MEWSKEVPMINFEQWEGFEGRIWKEEVNVRDFKIGEHTSELQSH